MIESIERQPQVLFLTAKFWIGVVLLIILTTYRSCTQNFTKHINQVEANLHRCSNKKVPWKYAVNLQENSHAEV